MHNDQETEPIFAEVAVSCLDIKLNNNLGKLHTYMNAHSQLPCQWSTGSHRFPFTLLVFWV